MASVAQFNVYLDTDVLVNCVYPVLPHGRACRESIERIKSADSRIFLSPLTTMEYAQAFRTLATQGAVSNAVHAEFELHRWSEVGIRQRWMEFWRDEFRRFLNSLPLVIELPVTPEIQHRCFDLMAQYALRSQDAIHLATALHYEIPVFWTCDDHFQRVDDLVVEIIRDPASDAEPGA